MGGDEFALMLPETGPDAARAALEKLRSVVSELEEHHAFRGVGLSRPPGLQVRSFAGHASAILSKFAHRRGCPARATDGRMDEFRTDL